MNRLAGAVAIGAVLRLPLGEPASFVTVRQADTVRSPIDSSSAAVSSDGRYVAFTSAYALVPADTNLQRDVYVLDRSDGRVTLEVAPPTEPLLRGDSDYPSISDDGRWVAYCWFDKVVVHDRRLDKSIVVAAGRAPVISGDGRFVAFTSSDVHLTAAPDANGEAEDVYVVDMSSGRIERASVDAQGLQPGFGASVSPGISGDGRLVAFSSTAPLSAGATKGVPHVYVRDLQSKTTRTIGAGWHPAISGDGRYVAFVSSDNTLAADDRNNLPDVFLADLHTSRIELVSRSAKGSGGGGSINPAISRDGRFVAFQSEASDLTCATGCARALEDINLLWDVFVFDRQTRSTTRISCDPSASWMEESSGPAIDATAATVVFSSRHPIDAADKANDFDLFIRGLGPP